MKFAMLFSCGKDSALALHRMVCAGHTPICLIVTYNSEAGRSWFHGVPDSLLDAVEASVAIPVMRCICTGETYESAVEACLAKARAMGAEAAVFGDIDIDEHFAWNRDRCRKAGLQCIHPLWRQSRERLVYEGIDLGMRAVVKCVQVSSLDTSYLGKPLDRGLLGRIAAAGADLCGENGEYHTFVCDGPLYKHPIAVRLGDVVRLGGHAAIEMTACETNGQGQVSPR